MEFSVEGGLVNSDGNKGIDGISDRVDDCQHVNGWMDGCSVNKERQGKWERDELSGVWCGQSNASILTPRSY